jgi:hypothetical protein
MGKMGRGWERRTVDTRGLARVRGAAHANLQVAIGITNTAFAASHSHKQRDFCYRYILVRVLPISLYSRDRNLVATLVPYVCMRVSRHLSDTLGPHDPSSSRLALNTGTSIFPTSFEGEGAAAYTRHRPTVLCSWLDPYSGRYLAIFFRRSQCIVVRPRAAYNATSPLLSGRLHPHVVV